MSKEPILLPLKFKNYLQDITLNSISLRVNQRNSVALLTPLSQADSTTALKNRKILIPFISIAWLDMTNPNISEALIFLRKNAHSIGKLFIHRVRVYPESSVEMRFYKDPASSLRITAQDRISD